MRFIVALQAFFRVLFSRQVANRVAEAMSDTRSQIVNEAASVAENRESKPVSASPAREAKPHRNDAISLLAVLQREARFVDFVQQPLMGFSDAEIGAVVREVHRDCARVLERMFSLRPATAQAEGTSVELEAGFDSGRFKLTGQIAGSAPYRGSIVHAGWEAGRCELPTWSGSDEAVAMVAPVEVEVRSS